MCLAVEMVTMPPNVGYARVALYVQAVVGLATACLGLFRPAVQAGQLMWPGGLDLVLLLCGLMVGISSVVLARAITARRRFVRSLIVVLQIALPFCLLIVSIPGGREAFSRSIGPPFVAFVAVTGVVVRALFTDDAMAWFRVPPDQLV